MGEVCRIWASQGDAGAAILFRENGHTWTLMAQRCHSGIYVAGHSIGLSPTGTACIRGQNVRPSQADMALMVNDFLLFNVRPESSSGTGYFHMPIEDFHEGEFDWNIIAWE